MSFAWYQTKISFIHFVVWLILFLSIIMSHYQNLPKIIPPVLSKLLNSLHMAVRPVQF